MSHHQWLTVFVIELAKPINLVLKFMFQNLKLIGRQKFAFLLGIKFGQIIIMKCRYTVFK